MPFARLSPHEVARAYQRVCIIKGASARYSGRSEGDYRNALARMRAAYPGARDWQRVNVPIVRGRVCIYAPVIVDLLVGEVG